MSTTKVQSDMVDIDGATTATIVAGDKINFLDITDSLVKEDTVQGILDLVSAGGFTEGTELTPTSGTTLSFTSIPSGTKLIILQFLGLSGADTHDLSVQLGDSGGLETSGYIDRSFIINTADFSGGAQSTSGFIINNTGGASIANYGLMMIALEDATNFSWVQSNYISSADVTACIGAGGKSLSAELTQLRVTATSSSYDAGAVNVIYI
jgi:hypothetical protein